MIKKHVNLTESEWRNLLNVSRHLGIDEDLLIHEAINQFILTKLREMRKEALNASAGIWKDYNPPEVRKEFDRNNP